MKTRSFAAFLAVCALCLSIPAPAPAAIDATAKIKVSLQTSVFNAAAATTTNTYFLKNISTTTLTGPFRVVLGTAALANAISVRPTFKADRSVKQSCHGRGHEKSS